MRLVNHIHLLEFNKLHIYLYCIFNNIKLFSWLLEEIKMSVAASTCALSMSVMIGMICAHEFIM